MTFAELARAQERKFAPFKVVLSTSFIASLINQFFETSTKIQSVTGFFGSVISAFSQYLVLVGIVYFLPYVFMRGTFEKVGKKIAPHIAGFVTKPVVSKVIFALFYSKY